MKNSEATNNHMQILQNTDKIAKKVRQKQMDI